MISELKIKEKVKNLLESIKDIEFIYKLFDFLNYETLDTSYTMDPSRFISNTKESKKIIKIYTISRINNKVPIYLITVKDSQLKKSFQRYVTRLISRQNLSGTLLIFTTMRLENVSITLPIYNLKTDKLELRTLNIEPKNIYRTDIEVISNIYIEDKALKHRDIFKIWDKAFDVEKVTEKFFDEYKEIFDYLKEIFIKQRPPDQWKNSHKYAHDFAHLFLNRLMFIYFIQKKEWLASDKNFINTFLMTYKKSGCNGKLFSDWLNVLFFEAFNNNFTKKEYFPENINQILQNAPFLNGGLFKEDDRLDTMLKYSISDEILIKKVFPFFNSYNFTISENTPLEIEVAVDPEMVGKVYESLVNVSEEKDEQGEAGIFYTDRVEVELMCKLSISKYLENHIGDISSEDLIKFVFANNEKEIKEIDQKLNREYKLNEIKNQLDDIKIIDPACGSGCFLVGMMNLLSSFQKRIISYDPNLSYKDYSVKKKIIEQNLYGVDVMHWAVKVAELRLWLQLVIETDLSVQELQSRPLLPDLSFKIRQGDSLIQEFFGKDLNLDFSDSKFITSSKRDLIELQKRKLLFFRNELKGVKQEDLEKEETKFFIKHLKDKKLGLNNKLEILKKSTKPKSEGVLFDEVIRENQKDLFDKKEFENEIKKIKNEIVDIDKTIQHLKEKSYKRPFFWFIDFAEIFLLDKQGFDIVIGNPPYVRQEKIAPSLENEHDYSEDGWRVIKKEYKTKLQNKITMEIGEKYKPDGKADLYIYFYFFGLKLLNRKGIFSFITSNSWLDVGFGKSIQEYLLENVEMQYIIDNSAKRSFKGADINTVITLFSATKVSKSRVLDNIVKFVLFKKPFDMVLNSKIFTNIKKIDVKITDEELTNLIDNLDNNEIRRVFPLKQNDLYKDGFYENKKGIEIYNANKWGGKFLRAPEIFYTILKKGKDKLVKLRDVAEIKRGVTTGANEFFYLDKEKIKKWQIEEEYLKPVIKSPKELKHIIVKNEDLKYKIFMCHKYTKELMGTNALKYIEWGEKNNYNKTQSCKVRVDWWNLGKRKIANYHFNYLINEVGITYIGRFFASDNFHNIYCDNPNIGAYLNSTLFYFFQSLILRSNFGGGLGKIQTYELKELYFLKGFYKDQKSDMLQRKIYSIYKELGFNSLIPVRAQDPNPLSDRKELDDIIFDKLGLTEEERKEVYWAVAELVKTRLDKAKSLKKKNK